MRSKRPYGHRFAARIGSRAAVFAAFFTREDPPLLWTIISEAALRNPVGGAGVLREQLTRLLDREAEHPKIIVQVVPLDAGAHPGLEGPLVLVARLGEPDVAYLEVQGRGHLVESGDEVADYGLLYDLLRAVALPLDASREMIAGFAKGITPSQTLPTS